MEIEDDLDTTSRQDILNALQLHLLAPSFIDTVMHLIEDTSDSSSSSSSSSSDEETISILGVKVVRKAGKMRSYLGKAVLAECTGCIWLVTSTCN